MPEPLEEYFQNPDEIGASEYRAVWEAIADGCTGHGFKTAEQFREHAIAMLEEMRDHSISLLRNFAARHPREVVAPGLPDALHALLRRLADYGRDEDIYSSQRRHFEQSEAVRKLCGLARRVADGETVLLTEVEAIELKAQEQS
jgi:hypothetical protein